MYEIGTLRIQIHNLRNSQLVDRLAVFHRETGEVDIQYYVFYVIRITMPQPKDIFYASSRLVITQKNQARQYYHVYQHTPYAMVEEQASGDYHIFLLTELLTHTPHPYFLPELLQLERGLITKNSCVLHCSYIAVENSAILFTAPSGGGKSTQADLWKEYRNAEIVNGDKSIISKENDTWNAHGIPFSGSSAYCLNKTYPLKAVVILDKGLENQLFQVGAHGFSNVFSQITVNPWDQDFCIKAMDLVIDLCNEIPVYYYRCTKTKDAVEVLSQELQAKGIINGII